MMGSSNKLSPMAGYYVRRLIQSQKASLLKQIEHASLSEAMLQEPEVILHHLVTNPSERLQRLNTLEILARAYQQLVADGQHPEQLTNVEKQILTVLGFAEVVMSGAVQNSETPSVGSNKNQTALTIAKAIEIIEDLVKCGERYLGPKIAKDYCMGACPESLKLNGFTFQEDHKLKVNRPLTDTLQGKEDEDFKAWVKLYIRRCSSIIVGFDALVNPQHLALCSISHQEI
jgi:hypothetical protein